MRFLLVLSLARALVRGPFHTSSSVTSLPIGIPRCVPESLRRRSGQGQDLSCNRMRANFLGSDVETTADLSLFMPRPEISEKTLMRERAGEISDTEEEVRARSSAKANDLIACIFER